MDHGEHVKYYVNKQKPEGFNNTAHVGKSKEVYDFQFMFQFFRILLRNDHLAYPWGTQTFLFFLLAQKIKFKKIWKMIKPNNTSSSKY